MHHCGARKGSERPVRYAADVVRALREDPVTRHLALDLEDATSCLDGALWQRRGGEGEVRDAGALLVVSCGRVAGALRRVLETVIESTGSAESSLRRELFWCGLDRISRSRPAKQLERARGVIERLQASADPAAKAVRKACLVDLMACVERARRTLVARTAAEEQLRELRLVEGALRKEHRRALVIVDAHLRLLFPLDTRRRGQYRPTWPGRREAAAS